MKKDRKRPFLKAETKIVFLNEDIICKSGIWGSGDPFESDVSNTDYNDGNVHNS